MTRSPLGAALLAVLTGLAHAAPARAIIGSWDGVLARDQTSEPGDWCLPPAEGWRGADGGFTARHGVSNRSIWFFGDTGIAEVADPGAWQPNTMLVTTSSPAHAMPSAANFWGSSVRRPGPGASYGAPP